MKHSLLILFFLIANLLSFTKKATSQKICKPIEKKGNLTITVNGDNNGNIVQATEIGIQNVYCNGVCYFIYKDLIIVLNGSIGSKKSEALLQESNVVNKKGIASKTVAAAPNEEKNCINSLIQEKIESNMYNAYQTLDKKTSLIAISYSEEEWSRFNVAIKYDISDGVYKVKSLNKYHYCNADGTFLITFNDLEAKQYDFASDFKKGIALVGNKLNRNTSEYYFINKGGQRLDDKTYSNGCLSNDYFIVKGKDGRYSIISNDNKVILPEFTSFINTKTGEISFRNKNQNHKIPYYEKIDTVNHVKGVFIVKTLLNEHFFINSVGDIISPIFSNKHTTEWHDEIFLVRIPEKNFLINTKTWKFSEEYNSIKKIPGSLHFIVNKKERTNNILDATFKEAIKNDFDSISIQGRNIIIRINNKYSILDISKNKSLLNGEYDNLTHINESGAGFWARTNSNGVFESGVYNSEGDMKSFPNLPSLEDCNPKYNVSTDNIIECDNFSYNKIAIAKTKNGQTIVNTKAEIVIPIRCGQFVRPIIDLGFNNSSIVEIIYDGLITKNFLIKEGKILKEHKLISQIKGTKVLKYIPNNNSGYGLLEINGKDIQPAIYKSIEKNKCDLLVSSKDGLYGAFSMEGKPLIDFKFKQLKECSDSLIVAKCIDGFWAILNLKGIQLTKCLDYDELSVITKDYIIAKRENKFGIISLQEKTHLPLVFDTLFFEGNSFICRKDGRMINLIISQNGLECKSGHDFYFEIMKDVK